MGPVLTIEDQVLAALRRITRAIDLHSRGLMQQVGLTAPQIAALRVIAAQPMTAVAIAKAIHLSQATVTGILARLERRGLITRVRSEADRRSFMVELTESGREVMKQAPSLLQDRFRHELLRLQNWEQTQMLATLQRIAAMMDADGIDAAPVLAVGSAIASSEEVSQFLNQAVQGELEAATTTPSSSTPSSSHEHPCNDNRHASELTHQDTSKAS